MRFGVIPNPFGPVVKGDLALARGDQDGLRVLFVGNSLTSVNGMPSLVRQLAQSDGNAQPLFVVQYTRDGGTLQQASRDKRLTRLLREVRWDYVVLQEQSEIPAFPLAVRQRLMDTSVSVLVRKIRSAGGRPVLFMTWGYRGGDRRYRADDTYWAMQERLEQGYREVAAATHAAVAPVGVAWADAVGRQPDISLWARDGKHPSKAGSYLAACVFYALLSGQHESTASSFTGGIAPTQAHFLQWIAFERVARTKPVTVPQT